MNRTKLYLQTAQSLRTSSSVRTTQSFRMSSISSFNPFNKTPQVIPSSMYANEGIDFHAGLTQFTHPIKYIKWKMNRIV